MQQQMTVEQLQQMVAQYTTAQISERIQLSIPKVRALLKEHGFTYVKKQWVYEQRNDHTKMDYHLSAEEILFFNEPLQSEKTQVEPIQLQPHLVEKVTMFCTEHDVNVHDFIELVLIEAMEKLQ